MPQRRLKTRVKNKSVSKIANPVSGLSKYHDPKSSHVIHGRDSHIARTLIGIYYIMIKDILRNTDTGNLNKAWFDF